MVKNSKKNLEKEINNKEEKAKEKKVKEIIKDEEIIELGSGKAKNKIKVSEEKFDESDPLAQFLANPWKQVSFEASGEVISSLDSIPRRKVEEDEEFKPIDYMASSSEEGMYISPGRDTKVDEPWKSEEEKTFDEQKRLYSNFQEKDVEDSSIKYVKPEDTQRKDYIAKKKFGD